MGKIRAKKRAALTRAAPAGLPSPGEVKNMETERSPASQHVLQRLSNSDSNERLWACTSLAHLLLDHTHLTELIKGRVVRQLTPLLLDKDLQIREAATGALRNMSSVDDVRAHEYMASEDIMTPLSALLRDTVTQLDSSVEEVKKVLLKIAEEALCLLWHMSETSPLIVEAVNREHLLTTVLQLLNPITLPSSLCLATAQLLHVVTEDNQEAIQLVASSPPLLTHLESTLVHPLPDAPRERGQMMVLQAAVAGVFANLHSLMPEGLSQSVLRGVLETLAKLMHFDLVAGCCGDSEIEGLKLILSAKELACEVLANLCFTEGEDGGDDEWEECDDVEDVEEVDRMESSVSPMNFDLPALRLIVEMQLHSEVITVYINTCSAFELCPQSLLDRLSSLLSASLLTLQNLVTSLPPESWCDHMTGLWPTLFTPPPGYTDHTHPVVGVLIAALDKLNCVSLLTEAQVVRVCESVGGADELGVRFDLMRLLGCVARLALRDTPNNTPILTVVGAALREAVKDPSLSVVAQALDSIFDLFGSDSCPPDLHHTLSLLPALRQVAETFNARFRVEKRSLGPERSLVQSAKVNLPRFIEYMTTKMTN